MSEIAIDEHLSNLGAFIDDAEHFDLADDSVVDTTEACAAFHVIVAEITRLRAELAASRHDAERMRKALEEISQLSSVQSDAAMVMARQALEDVAR